MRSMFFRCMRMAALSCLVAITGMATAQQGTVSHPADRFPPGSILSVEGAETALAAVAAERAEIDARFRADEAACYSQFFASACLDTAKERRRGDLLKLRPVELDANAFMRRNRAAERDQALADRRAEQTRRDAAVADSENAPAPKESANDVPQAEANPVATRSGVNNSSRAVRHDEKLRQLQREELLEAKKRSENIAAYEKKLQDAEARQKEVENRRQEKVKERAAKQASSSN
jgi:colicin import membrane protein